MTPEQQVPAPQHPEAAGQAQPYAGGQGQVVPGRQAQPGTVGQAQPGTAEPPAQQPRQHVLRRTRAGGVWVALTLSAVVLLLLLIFILENGHRANIGFFGVHANLPLGVALLLAAVAGALVVIIPGTVRIVQLRITARRHRRQDAAATGSQPPTAEVPADSPGGGPHQS